MELLISIIIKATYLYFLAGLAFAFFFLWKGISKVDEDARETKLGFKLIILPGILALWPVLLLKWIKSKPS